jgi:hypothetical protein
MKDVSYKEQCYRSNSGLPEYEEVTLTTHHVLSYELVGNK